MFRVDVNEKFFENTNMINPLTFEFLKMLNLKKLLEIKAWADNLGYECEHPSGFVVPAKITSWNCQQYQTPTFSFQSEEAALHFKLVWG